MAPRALAAAALACGACLAAAPAALAAAKTTDCTNLQATLDGAENGDVITLDNGGAACAGSFTLPAKAAPFKFTLQGAGAGATLTAAGMPNRILTGDATGGNEIDVTLRNLTFIDSSPASGSGGAISLTHHVSATIDQDRFFRNTAPDAGGAVHISSDKNGDMIAITDSVFGDGTSAGGNGAGNDSGAAYVVSTNGTPVDIRGNTFASNAADNGAGAVDAQITSMSSLTVDDNTFAGNSGAGNGGGAELQGRDLTVRRNTFTRNRLHGEAFGGSGAGLSVFGFGGGEATLTQSGNRFDGNAILGPTAADVGVRGGGEFLSNAQLDSTGDRFTNNSLPAVSGTGEAEGAGLSIEGCQGVPAIPSQVKDLVAAGNAIAGEGHGAGVYVGCNPGPAALTMLDSTVSGNRAGSGDESAAGLWGGPDDTLTLRNSIVAGNIGAADLFGFASKSVTASDACAPGPFPGANNICAAPFLANPGPGHGDAHETQFSPTIDHGSSAMVPPGLTTDFEGDARIVGPAVDMGADEFTAPSVVTGAAKSVRVDRATLNGTVTPNTHATSYRFEYGDDTNYGKSTASRLIPAGTALVPVALEVKGLRPSHSYHFRLAATNSAGTTYGLDGSFKTKADRWPGVKIAAETITVKKGRARVLLSCPKGTGGPCSKGLLKLRKYGKKKFSLKAGKKKRFKVKLSKGARRSLKHGKLLKVRATAVAYDVFGTKRKTHATLRLRPKLKGH